MALMTEHRLRHLPVIEKGKLVGLISIGDRVKDIIYEQKSLSTHSSTASPVTAAECH